jgi:flagellar motor switch protein FliN
MAADDTPPGTRVAGWVRGLQAQPQDAGTATLRTNVELNAELSGAPEPGVNIMDMVLDIPVRLSVELGRTKIPIKDILQLKPGSVVELDTLAVDLVDVLVNGHLIAQGEIVVVNDRFGIRLIDVVTAAERLKRLSKA